MVHKNAIDLLHVVVHFMGAGEPFKDDNASPNESVGQLKGRVLSYFQQTEGSTTDGGSVSFVMYHERTALTDLNQTIGAVAGSRPVLQLKLNKIVVQG